MPARGNETSIGKDGRCMILIPAGEFVMGSNDGNDDEKPQRVVYLGEYWIDQYPVTVARYRLFCNATGRRMPEVPYWGWKDDHPIVNVSWHDAMAYCQWADVRLPTEAQWEKAARGADGRKYPWGNDWDGSRCANLVGGTSLNGTVAIGSYEAGVSPYGIHDMAGNVWEWCADWYDANYHCNTPSRNPIGPVSGTYRILRGGSWGTSLTDNLRASRRFKYNPDYGNIFRGFRCAQGS